MTNARVFRWGELVHITEHGFERLHKAPRAPFRVA